MKRSTKAATPGEPVPVLIPDKTIDEQTAGLMSGDEMLTRLQATYPLSASEQRMVSRRIYGKAGTLNAAGDQRSADVLSRLAGMIMSNARKQAAPDHDPQRLHFERLSWEGIRELIDALSAVQAPAGMTVADLYWYLLTYQDANTEANHDRRHTACRSWPFDAYGCRSLLGGFRPPLTVRPGMATKSPLFIDWRRASARQGQDRRMLEGCPAALPIRRNLQALAAIREWESRQAQRLQACPPPVPASPADPSAV